MNSATFLAEGVSGEAFCFLPLSISTGLPVHVNSPFAVRSNRDGIWERTTAEENRESRWNESLLQDAIAEAYFKLLNGMVDLSKSHCLRNFDQYYHSFWPRLNDIPSKTWKILVSSFYTKLIECKLELFCSEGTWMDITKGFILDKDLREHLVDKVVKSLQTLGISVFSSSFRCNRLDEKVRGKQLNGREADLKPSVIF